MLFYPIGLVARLDTEKNDRVLADDFTDGSVQTRSPWPIGYFKRRFTLTHSPLTISEFRALAGFHAQVGGTYDTFYFRDNVHREGPAIARFSQPLKQSRSGSAYIVQLEMLESAPNPPPVSLAALTAAAGVAPILWYDSAREIYYQHLGAAYSEPGAYDTMLAYAAPWQAGALNVGSAFQNYNFTGIEWAKSASVTQLVGTAPDMTFFTLAKQSSLAANQLLFSVGTAGLNHSLGICLVNDVYYMYFGDITTAAGIGIGQNNAPVNTWRSLAFTCKGSTSQLALYGNAAAIVGTAYSHNFATGPFVIAADPAGANILNPANAMAQSALDHILLFPAALTAAQVKAVHNLIGPRFGLALVP